MISAFWDIPGIQSRQSLEFLTKLLDLICVYDERGQVLYVSSNLLSLLQTTAEEVNFFTYFPCLGIEQATLHQCWERAIQGETTCFLFNDSCSAIECSLQFNADARLMFLTAKQSEQNAYIHQVSEEYEQLVMSPFHHPSLATALLSPDGATVKCNQRLYELLGADPHEAIDLETFTYFEDRLIDAELKQKLLQGNLKTYTIEKRFLTRDQEIIWLNASISAIKLSTQINGYSQYLVALFEDITETKKIYNALIRTEGKWKALVLNSLNLFIQTSSNGRIIYVSPAVERILGYKSEELLDLHVLELIHPDDLNEFDLALHLWMSGVQPKKPGLECRWRTQTNGWATLYIQGQPFPLALEIDGMVISGYDITDRRKLEAELRTSEDKYRSLVVNIPGAIFRCDSTYTMEFVSDGIEAITGFSASDFVAERKRSYMAIVHPDDIAMIKDAMLESILNHRSCSVEYRIIQANGQIRWILERKQGRFDAGGNLLWFDGVLFDISDRKQAEENLRRSEAMNRAMAQVFPGLIKQMGKNGRILGFPAVKPVKTLPPPDQVI